MFFGNVVGIKINANGNLAWGTENIWTCVFYLLLYLSILLFFSSFYSFSLILSQKKFSVRTQSSLPQSSLHSSHTEVCRQLEKNSLKKTASLPLFFCNGNMAAYFVSCSRRSASKGRARASAQHALETPPPSPYCTDVGSLGLKGRVGSLSFSPLPNKQLERHGQTDRQTDERT